MERERWLCSSYDRRSTIEQEAGLPLHVLRFQYVARNLCYDEHTLHMVDRSIGWERERKIGGRVQGANATK